MMLERLNRSRKATLILLFFSTVLGIYVAQHLLTRVRADVTEEGIYSLTPGTKQILRRMQEEGVSPVDVRLYFSLTAGKTLPSFIKDFITYEEYVRNLLREYEGHSGGKVRVEFIDPVPDTDEAQDALDAGLDGKTINQNGDLFFFGITFETESGSRRVLDFLWPEEQASIEYEISKEIYNLTWPSSQRVAVLSPTLQVLGAGDNPYMAQLLQAQGKQPPQKWVTLELLQEQYELSSLPQGVEEISREQFDLLLILHPKELPEETLRAVDRWVQAGGNALIFMDPYATRDQPPLNPQDPQARLAAMQYQPASDLGPLLGAWGLEWEKNRFALDLELAGRSGTALQQPGAPLLVELLIDRQLHGDALSTDSPALLGIENLHFLLAGSLAPTAGAPAGVTLTPLVTTTEQGDAVTIEPGFGTEGLHYFDIQDPYKLQDAYNPRGPQALAYLIHGDLPPAYPDAPPAAVEGEDEGKEGEFEKPADSEATVVVVADTDLLTDNLAFSQSFLGILSLANDNSTLLLNLVDFLLGSEELMQVRARKGIERPFTLFDQIEGAAEQESLEREKELRAEIETFQSELQAEERSFTERNAALMEKRLRDEVEQLNERVREANRELLEIRQQRRAALENEEANVRFTVMWAMPLLVLLVGILTAARRRWSLTQRTPSAGREG